MSRNALLAVVAVLVVVAGVLAWQLGAERADNNTIELNVGESGVELQTK